MFELEAKQVKVESTSRRWTGPTTKEEVTTSFSLTLSPRTRRTGPSTPLWDWTWRPLDSQWRFGFGRPATKKKVQIDFFLLLSSCYTFSIGWKKSSGIWQLKTNSNSALLDQYYSTQFLSFQVGWGGNGNWYLAWPSFLTRSKIGHYLAAQRFIFSAYNCVLERPTRPCICTQEKQTNQLLLQLT